MTSRDHASLARTRKVLKLAANIRHGEDARECEVIADRFALLTQPERDSFARECGVNSPSDITWELLVQVLRDRAGRLDPFARVRIEGGR